MSDATPSNPPMLDEARQHLLEGRLEQAEAICRRLLADHPREAEALSLAGLVAHERGQAVAALELLEQAAAEGNQGQFHYNLGIAYQSRGRVEDALAAYRRALQLEPESAEVHNNLGYALFQLGRLDEAVESLKQALRLHPAHAGAHNNLGLALAARGEMEQAARSYRRAIRSNAELAEAHFNLGIALAALGKKHEAAGCYRRAVELRGHFPEAQRLLALLLAQIDHGGDAIEALEQAVRLFPDDVVLADKLGSAYCRLNRFEEAVESYRAAVRLNPDSAGCYNNLGHGLRNQGRLDEAVEAFQQALALCPGLAETHVNLGKVWAERQDHVEAAKAFERALEIEPDHSGAHGNLANALVDQGRLEDAIAEYLESIRLQPRDAGPHVLLGNVYGKQKRYAEAEKCYREAVRLAPTDPVVHSNLGNLLTLIGRPDEAEAECRLALALKPDYADALHNRSIALAALARDDEAAADREAALRLRPDFPMARLCRAFGLLKQGNLEEGLPEYEWRWHQKDVARPEFQQPEWDGSPLEGRTILLHAEQGLGDTMQFIRYAPLVQKRGGRVVVQCHKLLTKLLARAPGIDQLVPRNAPLPDFDVHLPLLSAPLAVGTAMETIPAETPYLFADEGLAAKWKEELSRYEGLKIGISWQGNPGFGGDTMRSVPLRHFERVGRLPGVRLFSLQKGFGREQLDEAAGRFEVIDLADRIDFEAGAFMDSAAVIRNLDLVIVSDSAVAHLAGALGAPTWLVLPLGPDWRWFERREDSPWYPTMRLFRQRQLNGWDEVFQRLADEVEGELARRGISRSAMSGLITLPVSGAGRSSPDVTTENSGERACSAAPALDQDAPNSAAIPANDGAAAEADESARLREISRVRGELWTAAGRVGEFQRLQRDFARIDGDAADDVEGFLLYSLARDRLLEGRVVQIGSRGKLNRWLAAGCRAAGQEKLALLETALDAVEREAREADLSDCVEIVGEASAEASAAWSEPVRLLVIDGGLTGEALDAAFSAWSKHVAPLGLAVVRGVGGRTELTQLYERLRDSEAGWKELPPVAGLSFLEKQSPREARRTSPRRRGRKPRRAQRRDA